jgi:hypothetical protein
MKSIFAILVLAMASFTISAQEPTATPAAPQTPAVTPKPAEAPVPVVDKEPVSKIVEPMAVCDLGIANSPIIHGLQLGMSEVEASLKLRSQFEKDAADATRSRANAKFDGDTIFENVRTASLTSVNGKVSSIKLDYTTKWPTIKDFVWDFGPKLGLIRIAFRRDEERNEAKTVCKDFTAEMRSSATGSELILTDTRDHTKVAPPKTQ